MKNAVFQALIRMISKMASVIITLKIMPESPDTDVQELESIIKKKIGKHTGNKEFRINSIIIYDDLFTVKKERVMEICRGILERGLKIEWKCEGRVNIVEEDAGNTGNS